MLGYKRRWKMKSKDDLLLEGEKIKAALLFDKMDADMERSYKALKKTRRISYILNGMYLFVITAGWPAMFILVWGGNFWIRELVIFAYTLAGFSFIFHAIREYRNDRQFDKNHVLFLEKQKIVRKELGIDNLIKPEDGKPQEKMVN